MNTIVQTFSVGDFKVIYRELGNGKFEVMMVIYQGHFLFVPLNLTYANPTSIMQLIGLLTNSNQSSDPLEFATQGLRQW